MGLSGGKAKRYPNNVTLKASPKVHLYNYLLIIRDSPCFDIECMLKKSSHDDRRCVDTSRAVPCLARLFDRTVFVLQARDSIMHHRIFNSVTGPAAERNIATSNGCRRLLNASSLITPVWDCLSVTALRAVQLLSSVRRGF